MPVPDLPELLSREAARLPRGAIVVGYSGGMDSTVLLHALASLPAVRERGLRALHVDHGLLPDSAEWARHCTAAAAALGVPCDCVVVDVAVSARTGREGAARTARYRIFGERLRDGEVLALAQHADDQAETVLLKLLRGAGPEGLAGMRVLRPFASGWLWRPLLALPRAALRDYAHAHALRWIDDPSNADTRLRRNFLRAEILPRLQQRWPDATVAIGHSARWAAAAAAFIDGEARLALARLQGADPSTLAWRDWLALADALRDPVLRLWLRALGRDEPAHFQVAELERQLRASGGRAACVRWGGSEVRRYRDLLYAMPVPQPVPAEWCGEWNGDPLLLPGGGQLSLVPNGAGAAVPHEPVRLSVAYRRGGERLKPAGSRHTRELRLLLQEAGMPPWLRSRLPLISHDGELIAAGDLFVSEAGKAFLERRGLRIVWESGE